MKRFRFFSMLFILLIYQPVSATFRMERVSYDLEWRESEQKNRFQIQGDGSLQDFNYDLKGRFDLPTLASRYSSMEFGFGVPKWDKNLSLRYSYQWSEHYRLTTEGIAYVWEPWRNLKINLSCSRGEREGISADRNDWRYQMDSQSLAVKYTMKPFQYRGELSRTFRDYQFKPAYTATHWRLEDYLHWEIRKWVDLGVTYQEASGDYPDDPNLKNSYWKNSYRVFGNFKLPQKQVLGWSYREYYWEKAFQTYRDKQTIELGWKNPISERASNQFKFGYANLQYYPLDGNELITPEDDFLNPTEDDLNSRQTLMLGWEYQRTEKTYSYSTDLFIRKIDFRSPNKTDLLEWGGSFTLKRKFDPWEVDLALYPFGNLENTKAFCRFKLVYHFDRT